jgi:thioredoxin reductase (NADPH)
VVENVVIAGSGCAGLTSAIYCARAGLNPLVIDGTQPGGQLTTTDEIENFPGFVVGVNGFELTNRMRTQAERFGARFLSESIAAVDFSINVKKIICNATEIETYAAIIATGAASRMANVPGEKEFFGGRGVSVCATCDAPFFRGKVVCVVGGGDSACEEALFLAKFCERIFVIHRRDEFRASRIMADKVLNNSRISVVWNSVLHEIFGEDKVRGIRIRNVNDAAISEIGCDGVFLAIGHTPNTGPFKSTLAMDNDGYILGKGYGSVETAIDGVFVAGDCSDRKFRQAITAAGMGCMAAISAERFLAKRI